MEIQIHDSKFDLLMKKMADHFKPTKIYLFGSRAKGTARPESDYDLFIIVKDSNKSPIQRMQEANRILWGSGISADIFVYTEAEFNAWKDELNSIACIVASEGVELPIV